MPVRTSFHRLSRGGNTRRIVVLHGATGCSMVNEVRSAAPADLAQEDKTRLLKAITLRHDCVHRNGFDKDGNELIVFTRQFVKDTADLIRDFVAKIESQLGLRTGQVATEKDA